MYKFTSCRFIPQSAMIASRAGTSSSRSIWLCKTNLGLSSGIFYLLVFEHFLITFWIEITYDPNLQIHLKSFHRFFHSISHTSGRRSILRSLLILDLEDYIKPYIYIWNQQIEYSNRPMIPLTSPSFDVIIHFWFDKYDEVQQDHIESWINKLKIQLKSGTIIHEDYIKPYIYIYAWNQQIEYSNKPMIPLISPSLMNMLIRNSWNCWISYFIK